MLTDFKPTSSYDPCKNQKIKGFPMFQGVQKGNIALKPVKANRYDLNHTNGNVAKNKEDKD